MAELIFNAAEFNENTQRMEMNLVGLSKKTLIIVADEILRLSQIEVPHNVGTLQNTGVAVPEGDDVIVGYNMPYAARLHEHPEYNFKNGRKGKFLEDPIKNNLKAFNQLLGQTLSEGLK